MLNPDDFIHHLFVVFPEVSAGIGEAAGFAFGLTGQAGVSSVQDQPMMRLVYQFFGQVLDQFFLYG